MPIVRAWTEVGHGAPQFIGGDFLLSCFQVATPRFEQRWQLLPSLASPVFLHGVSAGHHIAISPNIASSVGHAWSRMPECRTGYVRIDARYSMILVECQKERHKEFHNRMPECMSR